MDNVEQKQGDVVFYKKTKTKKGRDVSSWLVTCPWCGSQRIINRADHAKRLSKTRCKTCSNKNNHPQGEHRGIRISFFNKFKIGAKNRNIDFEIDIDNAADLAEYQNKKCALSGLELIFNGNFNDITASLDRIDSNIGYIDGNIQWVHKDINMMKGTLSMERFLFICEKISANRVKW